MITYEQIKKANEAICTTDIQGKQYAEVNQRVKAFRMVYPNGTIRTEIVSLVNGVVTFKAEVYDGELLLADGYAYEKEGANFINKTSFIENAQTSAIGRALGFAGFGIDTSIASAEEVQNAKASQKNEKPNEEPKEEKKASQAQINILKAIYKDNLGAMLEHYELEEIEDMPMTLASKIIAAKKKGETK